MIKHRLIKVGLLLAAASLTACSLVTKQNESTTDITAKTNKKMNVLYIMTDDHAAHAFGAYGGRLAKLNPTPNLDALANEGTRFENVFVTNSICTPSRASILTGQYSQTNGVLDLKGSLSTEQQTLPLLLNDEGYETAVIGKWHLKKEPGAFDYYEVLELQGKYFDPVFRTQGTKPWPQNEATYKGHSSDVITDLSIEWLKNRKKDKPFFLMHQFKAPHDYFEYAPRYESYLADVEIPEPADLYQVANTHGSIATRGKNDELMKDIGTSISQRHNRRSLGLDLGVDENLSHTEFTKKSYQKFLKAYLRCVKGVDDNVARLIQTLKDMGEYENTIIVYTSDQGMMLGEHDYQDKRWMYEESIHMPFVVHDPRVKNAANTSDLLINNTDFAPFILDLVDAEIPDDMHGRSFRSALKGEQPDDWRTATYYRYWTHRMYHDVPAHFGLRTKEYKLIMFYGAGFVEPQEKFYDRKWVNKTGLHNNNINTPVAWELYDLRHDPQELVNVYNDPQYASTIVELKKELKRQRQVYNETDENYPKLKAIIEKHWND
ncbi:sulfatase family protein [Algibacillus agarilyticus]|uniref:sulfatase family protein n=1 Tax=Algibacillus agarilyticus TaxID=2234133 RepID=UPI001E30D35E|nr:sulfatase [Algibacillus agarilyticus]